MNIPFLELRLHKSCVNPGVDGVLDPHTKSTKAQHTQAVVVALVFGWSKNTLYCMLEIILATVVTSKAVIEEEGMDKSTLVRTQIQIMDKNNSPQR
jgi:hypothetical protein